VANLYVKSGGGTPGSGTYRGVWTPSTTWAVGDRIVATNVISYRVMECTAGGAGGGTEPTWNVTTGGTTTDGGATFTTRIPTTWANATTDLNRVSQNDASGDVIYASQSHNASAAGSLTFAWAGSNANPTRVICADDTSGEPPTVMAYTAVEATTGAGTLTPISGGAAYISGFRFKAGDGSAVATLLLNAGSGNDAVYDNCYLELGGADPTSRIDIRHAALLNTWMKFSHASQYCSAASSSMLRIDGGGIENGSAAVTTLFGTVWANGYTQISGFDFSNAASSITVFTNTGTGTFGLMRNCRPPESWGGDITTGAGSRSKYTLVNTDYADTQYRFSEFSFYGNVKSQVGTLIRSGGATDGATAYSWKMTTGTDSGFTHKPVVTPELTKRLRGGIGMPVTVTVHFLRDNVTAMHNKQIALEVQYLGTDGKTISSFVSNAAASYLATQADHPASSATWDTTGMANPNKQKLSVTFTPRRPGFINAVVKLYAASQTVYVDPKLEITW
jgi:hypothetical protein